MVRSMEEGVSIEDCRVKYSTDTSVIENLKSSLENEVRRLHLIREELWKRHELTSEVVRRAQHEDELFMKLDSIIEAEKENSRRRIEIEVGKFNRSVSLSFDLTYREAGNQIETSDNFLSRLSPVLTASQLWAEVLEELPSFHSGGERSVGKRIEDPHIGFTQSLTAPENGRDDRSHSESTDDEINEQFWRESESTKRGLFKGRKSR